MALLQGNLGHRLLSEQNLLESGAHLHITVRHNKGCFLLGRICKGHAGGIRIPLGEHHVVGGVIFRRYGNGFPSHCRGGICRASAVYNLDAVRHFFSWEVYVNSKLVCRAAKVISLPEIAAGNIHVVQHRISKAIVVSRFKIIHYCIVLMRVTRGIFVFNHIRIRSRTQALINRAAL